jgi:hypothetical protein
VRFSAETVMQHTLVIACVTVISEPLDKLPSAWCGGSTSGSVAAVKGGVKTDQRGSGKPGHFAMGA